MIALEHGSFMARLFKADIVLVHIIEAKVMTIDLGKVSASDRKSAAEIVQTRLDEIARDVKVNTGAKVTTVVKAGKIAKMIKEASEEYEVDMILMGTHGVSGFEEFFIGSNAFRVVTEAK